MKTILFFFALLIASTLFAYDDSDLDGVDDAVDKCPNTPFTELVDINGCTTKILVSQHHYDVIVGASYSDSDYQTLNKTDTLSTTLQADYYYKNFSLGIATSYFQTEGSGYKDRGFNDSYLNVSYQDTPFASLVVRGATGVILPTYSTDLNNNNTDYFGSLNMSYSFEKFNLFCGATYTMVMDDNVIVYDTNSSVDVQYQNTLALSIGTGYYVTEQLYASVAYNRSDSIYKSIEEIKTLSIFTNYAVSEHLFSTLSYAKGLSDSASKNYLSVRIGYYF